MTGFEQRSELVTQERARLADLDVSAGRRALDDVVSAVCWYWTSYETGEAELVAAFRAIDTAFTPTTEYERFASHAVDAGRQGRAMSGPTEVDREGWLLANELIWRLGGEMSQAGAWRVNLLFAYACIADFTTTPYLAFSRVVATAESGAVAVPTTEEVEWIRGWRDRWEAAGADQPGLETAARSRARRAVPSLLAEATTLQGATQLAAALAALPSTRWAEPPEE